MAKLGVTRWRIVQIPAGELALPGVVLILDSTARLFVEAIEDAARKNGIVLRRIGDEE